ncbi:repeat-containing protein [Candidatus Omnitrophus magneticus]|uniref:Repeat-containing protein n=1 Tax=Candidatus Omnitrophus magneticus TaxID=1609969 RepID=A0A0F0CRQ6_9BACT|nr:repeat-containing protein [Candidatus Omnitrophus magneticus]
MTKIIGSSPGFVGSERSGLLLSRVKDRPYSVILFDEVDKAHEKALTAFIGAIEDGKMTDQRTQKQIDFTNTIIIFTSNMAKDGKIVRGNEGKFYIERRRRAGSIDYVMIPENLVYGGEYGETPVIKVDENILDYDNLKYHEFVKLLVTREKEKSEDFATFLNKIGSSNVLLFNKITRETAEKVLKEVVLPLFKKMYEEGDSDFLLKIEFENEDGLINNLLQDFNDKDGMRPVINKFEDIVAVKIAEITSEGKLTIIDEETFETKEEEVDKKDTIKIKFDEEVNDIFLGHEKYREEEEKSIKGKYFREVTGGVEKVIDKIINLFDGKKKGEKVMLEDFVRICDDKPNNFKENAERFYPRSEITAIEQGNGYILKDFTPYEKETNFKLAVEGLENIIKTNCGKMEGTTIKTIIKSIENISEEMKKGIRDQVARSVTDYKNFQELDEKDIEKADEVISVANKEREIKIVEKLDGETLIVDIEGSFFLAETMEESWHDNFSHDLTDINEIRQDSKYDIGLAYIRMVMNNLKGEIYYEHGNGDTKIRIKLPLGEYKETLEARANAIGSNTQSGPGSIPSQEVQSTIPAIPVNTGGSGTQSVTGTTTSSAVGNSSVNTVTGSGNLIGIKKSPIATLSRVFTEEKLVKNGLTLKAEELKGVVKILKKEQYIDSDGNVSPNFSGLDMKKFINVFKEYSADTFEKITEVLNRCKEGHKEEVTTITISVDGKSFISGSKNETKVWDISDNKNPVLWGNIPQSPGTHISDGNATVLTWDEKILIRRVNTREIQIQDISIPEDKKILSTIREHKGKIIFLGLNKDEKILISGSDDGEVMFWDITNRAKPQQLGGIPKKVNGKKNKVSSLALNSDKNTLITGNCDGEIIVWDINDPKIPKVVAMQQCHDGSVSSVAIGVDEEILISGGSDGAIKIHKLEYENQSQWNSAEQERSGLSDIQGQGRPDVQIPADPNRNNQDENAFKLINERVPIIDCLSSKITIEKFDREGLLLTDKKYEELKGRLRDENYVDNQDNVNNVDNSNFFWDNSNKINTILNRWKNGHKGDVEAIDVSPDGKMLASGDSKGEIKIWDMTSFENPKILGTIISRRIVGHTSSITALSVNADKNTLVSASADGSVKIWDISNPKNAIMLSSRQGSNYGNWATTVRISNSGKILIIGNMDKQIQILDVSDRRSPKVLKTILEGRPFEVIGVRASVLTSAGNLLISGSDNCEIVIRDISNPKSEKILATIKEHKHSIMNLELSKDEKTLASIDNAGNIKIWDITNLVTPKKIWETKNDKIGNALVLSRGGSPLINQSSVPLNPYGNILTNSSDLAMKSGKLKYQQFNLASAPVRVSQNNSSDGQRNDSVPNTSDNTQTVAGTPASLSEEQNPVLNTDVERGELIGMEFDGENSIYYSYNITKENLKQILPKDEVDKIWERAWVPIQRYVKKEQRFSNGIYDRDDVIGPLLDVVGSNTLTVLLDYLTKCRDGRHGYREECAIGHGANQNDRYFFCYRDKYVSVVDIHTRKEVKKIPVSDSVWAIKMDPSGEFVIFDNGKNDILSLNLKDKQVRVVVAAGSKEVRSIGVEKNYLWIGYKGGSFEGYRKNSKMENLEKAEFSADKGSIGGRGDVDVFKLTDDERFLFTGAPSGVIKWDLRTMKNIKEYRYMAAHIDISKAGKYLFLADGYEFNRIRKINIENGKCEAEVKGFKFVLSSNKKYLFSATSQGLYTQRLSVWDIDKEECIKTLDIDFMPEAMYLSQDEKVLICVNPSRGIAHIKLQYKSSSVSTILGARKEKSTSTLSANNLSEIPESYLKGALNSLKQTHPAQYEVLKDRVKKYCFTQEEMYSVGGVTVLANGETALVIEQDFKNKLDALDAKTREAFLYLLLVHEATELLARDKNETIKPDITSEIIAFTEEIKAYWLLEKSTRESLIKATEEMDRGEPDIDDRFSPVLKFMEELGLKNLIIDKSLIQIELFLKNYPVYKNVFADFRKVRQALNKVTEENNKLLIEAALDEEEIASLLETEAGADMKIFLKKLFTKMDEIKYRRGDKDEKLVIAIDCDWIPEASKSYFKEILKELEQISKRRGFEHLDIIIEEGEYLEKEILKKHSGNLSNVIVLAEKESLAVGYFDKLCQNREKSGAFILGVDMKNFSDAEYLKEKGKHKIDDLKLFEMISLSLDLFSRRSEEAIRALTSDAIRIEKDGKGYIILILKASAVDYRKFQNELATRLMMLRSV